MNVVRNRKDWRVDTLIAKHDAAVILNFPVLSGWNKHATKNSYTIDREEPFPTLNNPDSSNSYNTNSIISTKAAF